MSERRPPSCRSCWLSIWRKMLSRILVPMLVVILLRVRLPQSEAEAAAVAVVVVVLLVHVSDNMGSDRLEGMPLWLESELEVASCGGVPSKEHLMVWKSDL